MSDKLISAQALIEDIEQRYLKGKVTLRELIDEQPIACDIDEKIKQLEAEADNGDYYVDGFVDIDRIKEILKGGAE
jgi:predicted amino acid-binding ACT domain protein